MKSKPVKAVLAVVFAAGVVFGGRHLLQVLTVASAFYAKTVCSGVFVSGRKAGDVIAEDVLADIMPGMRRIHASIDREKGLVRTSLYGLARRSALYRRGLGCTLLNGASEEALLSQTRGLVPLEPAPAPRAPWPEGEVVETQRPPPGVDPARLRAALDDAFAEADADALKRTRAVVVVYKGRIVAERYARGVGADMPLPGWSLGKSITAALTGILVREGLLKTAASGLFPEWRNAGDARARITLDQLLRMTGGLDFDAPHERALSDVRRMLFLERDAAAYARRRPAVAEPGSWWQYGSGSSVLVNALIRDAVTKQGPDYFRFPRRALFNPLGMRSAVLEPDAAGTFLSPAFAYASARDWARFGLFILRDGVWNGKRILPEGWVGYCISPTPASGGLYGAHFWRRVPPFLRPPGASERRLPEDRFYMLGHDGQMVAMIPSRDLVVVRLGLSRRRGAFDPDALLFEVLKAFQPPR